MGLCADWESADPYTGDVSWDFVQLAQQPSRARRSSNELLARPRQNSAQRWIMVDPPTANSFRTPPSRPSMSACAPRAHCGRVAPRF